MTKLDDNEFQVKQVEKVDELNGDGWLITCHDGWSFFIENRGVEPHVGSIATFYGRGVGFTVRGLDIDGREVFYRSPEKQAKQDAGDLAAREAKEKREFEQKRAELDADFAALPVEFQNRIARFRSNNPDFRWKLEGYEMFVCKQAVAIAARVKPGDYDAFRKLDWKQQREIVPEISDQHSGNTFGAACRLAYLYLNRPEFVEKDHGALCPLLGCKDYGCLPKEVGATNR